MGIVASSLAANDFAWASSDLIAAAAAGANLAIHGDDPERVRLTAALLANAGLPTAHALRAITSHPGAMFGAANVGRLQAGSPADLVIWSGSPLDLRSRPLMIMVGGQAWEETR